MLQRYYIKRIKFSSEQLHRCGRETIIINSTQQTH